MAEFWYNIILPRFGEENVKLLYSGKKYIQIFFINIHISDTDSFYIQFEDYDWDKVLTILEDKIDFSNFEKSHVRYSSSRKAMFGFVKVDTGTDIIHAFLGERKKSYQLFTDKTSPTVNSVYDLDRKTVKKKVVQKEQLQN